MAARPASIKAFLPTAVMGVHDALLIHLSLHDMETRQSLRAAVESLRDGALGLGLGLDPVEAALAEVWREVEPLGGDDDAHARGSLLDWAREVARSRTP